MTQAPELPPLHMRRDAFNPTPELRKIRETDGVRTVTNAFGMKVYLVTRHEDIKDVLSDHERFSNARPPGFVVPGAPAVPEEEQASARAGNLLGLDPPEHQRLRRMLTARVHDQADEAAGAAHRRDRRRTTGRDGKGRAASGFGGELRAADPVAGDLRAARRAV